MYKEAKANKIYGQFKGMFIVKSNYLLEKHKICKSLSNIQLAAVD